MIAMQSRIQTQKKTKWYVIKSEEEDESGEQEDAKDLDPNYNLFFYEETLFWDPQRTQEAKKGLKMKKKESVASNSMERALDNEGYPFKKIIEDVYECDGYAEEDRLEPKDTNSL